MTYIHFTEEQKYRASCVDLVEFLRRQGEKLIRSGPEYRMASDHSVTVRGNEWYDHIARQGGHADQRLIPASQPVGLRPQKHEPPQGR